MASSNNQHADNQDTCAGAGSTHLSLPKPLRRGARPQAINTEERRHAELLSANSTARRQLASLQDKLSRIEQQVRRGHSLPTPASPAAAVNGVPQFLAGIYLGVVWGPAGLLHLVHCCASMRRTCRGCVLHCVQGQLKVEAAAALVEEQLKRREAVEAEHAAGDARAAEQEAQVGGSQPCRRQTGTKQVAVKRSDLLERGEEAPFIPEHGWTHVKAVATSGQWGHGTCCNELPGDICHMLGTGL